MKKEIKILTEEKESDIESFESFEDFKNSTGINLAVSQRPLGVIKKLKSALELQEKLKLEPRYDLPIGPLPKKSETYSLFTIIREIVDGLNQKKEKIKFLFQEGDLIAEFKYFNYLQKFNVSKILETADFSQIAITGKRNLDNIFDFLLKLPKLNDHYLGMFKATEPKSYTKFYREREKKHEVKLITQVENIVELYAISLYSTSFYILFNSFCRTGGRLAKPFTQERSETATNDLSAMDSKDLNNYVRAMLLLIIILGQGIRKLSTYEGQLFTSRVEAIHKDSAFFAKRYKDIESTGIVRDLAPCSSAAIDVFFTPTVKKPDYKVFTLFKQDFPVSASIAALSFNSGEMEQLFAPGTRFHYLKLIQQDQNKYFICTPTNTTKDYHNTDDAENLEIMRGLICEMILALKKLIGGLHTDKSVVWKSHTIHADSLLRVKLAYIEKISNLWRICKEEVCLDDVYIAKELSSIENLLFLMDPSKQEEYELLVKNLKTLFQKLITLSPAQIDMRVQS